MDSFDTHLHPSGSRLLSESPPSTPFAASSASHTGHGGSDLSLSELSLSGRTPVQRPFSLLAQPPDPGADAEQREGDGEGEELEGGGEDEERRTRLAAKVREEKLQNDLFVLRKLNATFASYNQALKETQSGTQVRVSCISLLYVASSK